MMRKPVSTDHFGKLMHARGATDDDIPGYDPIRKRMIEARLLEQLGHYIEEAKIRLAKQVKVYDAKEYSQEFLRSLTDPKGW